MAHDRFAAVGDPIADEVADPIQTLAEAAEVGEAEVRNCQGGDSIRPRSRHFQEVETAEHLVEGVKSRAVDAENCWMPGLPGWHLVRRRLCTTLEARQCKACRICASPIEHDQRELADRPCLAARLTASCGLLGSLPLYPVLKPIIH